MAEQSTWIPLPRRRSPKIKIGGAQARLDRLANWYEANKPSVKRIAVTPADYTAFKESAGTNGVTLHDGVLRYRDFIIEPAT